jgi:chorismate dehydratase
MKRELSRSGEALRIGAVTYLNARPLIAALPEAAPHWELVLDHPSRLAEGLAAGRLDVGLIPSIEFARGRDYAVVSDACIACEGPVRSVRLYGRVPIEDVRTLALDDGSRTSAALTRILLRRQFGLTPKIEPLPIGSAVESSSADAVLLIGDRGMTAVPGRFQFVWDLGQQWFQWTRLPFVFALWVARPGLDLSVIGATLTAARDEGLRRLPQIARCEAPHVGIAEQDCLDYLRQNLYFHFGPRQHRGLERFYELAAEEGFAPPAVVNH